MWFFKKIVDVYYIILFEWFEIFFVSGIFNRMVIILIYLLQKKKPKWRDNHQNITTSTKLYLEWKNQDLITENVIKN